MLGPTDCENGITNGLGFNGVGALLLQSNSMGLPKIDEILRNDGPKK